MVTEEQFYSAVASDVDDDAPRLIYADWLDEQGTEAGQMQAELIRVQCRLAGLFGDEPERLFLRKRERELEDAVSQPLMKKLRRIGVTNLFFDRGFLSLVEMTASDFLTHAEKLFTICPRLTGLKIVLERRPVQDLLRAAKLARLHTLDLSRNPKSTAAEWLSGAAAFTSGPHTVNLQRLRLAFCQLSGAAALNLLTESEGLRSLRTLDLAGAEFTGDEQMRLGTEKPPNDLRKVILADSSVGVAGATSIGASRVWNRLATLNLSRTRIDGEGAAAIASSPRLEALHTFNASNCDLGDRGARLIAAKPLAPALKVLDLSGNGVRGEGAKALAASKHLSQLDVLIVRDNNLGADGAAALGASKHLAKVRIVGPVVRSA